FSDVPSCASSPVNAIFPTNRRIRRCPTVSHRAKNHFSLLEPSRVAKWKISWIGAKAPLRRRLRRSKSTEGFNLRFAVDSNQTIGLATSFKQNHRRDTENIEARGNGRIFVHIYLVNLDVTCKLLRNCFDCRRHRAARSTPWSPEVYENGLS